MPYDVLAWRLLITPGLRSPAPPPRRSSAPKGADYARAFGRLGDPAQATAVHRAAGLAGVQAETLRHTLGVQDARALWAWMTGENGHVRRLDATLSVSERAAVLDELDRLLARHRTHDGSLALPRVMTLVALADERRATSTSSEFGATSRASAVRATGVERARFASATHPARTPAGGTCISSRGPRTPARR